LVAAAIQFLICGKASGSATPTEKTEFAVQIVQTAIAIATIAMADHVTADLMNYSTHIDNDSQ
jgi:hypothetical protein